jgi:hypothetical protein
MTTSEIKPPPTGYEYGEARRRYVEQYGSTLVMNTYLKLALLLVSVAASQMRQQLMLGVLADQVVSAVHGDAGLVELRQQLVDRHLERLGELAYGHISHAGVPRTSGRAPS